MSNRVTNGSACALQLRLHAQTSVNEQQSYFNLEQNILRYYLQTFYCQTLKLMSPTCSKSVRRTKKISCEITKTKGSIICNEKLIDNIDFQHLKTAPEQKMTLLYILVGGLPVSFHSRGASISDILSHPSAYIKDAAVFTLTSNVSTSTSV